MRFKSETSADAVRPCHDEIVRIPASCWRLILVEKKEELQLEKKNSNKSLNGRNKWVKDYPLLPRPSGPSGDAVLLYFKFVDINQSESSRTLPQCEALGLVADWLIGHCSDLR